MIKIKLQLFTLGTNTMDDGTDSVALARQQLYDNFTRMGFGPTTDGITTIGEANKTVKTDEKGDIYERGNRVAEDFKTGRQIPSVFLNGTNAYISVANNDNINFGTGTFSYIGEHLFESGSVIRYKLYKQQGPIGFQVQHNSTNKVFVYVSDGTNSITITSTNALTDGRFHTIGFICGIDSASCKLIIDGIEDTTAVKVGTLPVLSKTNVAPLYIGSMNTILHKNEVRNTQIFNYALTVENCRKYMYESLSYSEIGANNANLLSNGDFETGVNTELFTKIGTTTVTYNDTDVDRTGNYNLKIVTGSQLNGGISKDLYIPGKRYRVKIRAKIDTGTAPLNVSSASDGKVTVNTVMSEYILEFIASDPVMYINLSGITNKTLIVDDIVIQRIGCVLDLTSDSIANTGWFDKSGNNLHATYTNALPFNLQNYKPRIQGYSADMRGANVASATTITPSGELFHVTGTTAIATINVPYTAFNGSITIIPDGIFTWTTAGNIALAGTAVVGKALTMTYDTTTAKWYPSY